MPATPLAATAQPSAFPIPMPNPFSWGAGKVIDWIVKGITKAINAFFGDLVTSALNPLLKLLGQTLLTTPNPSTLPQLGALWENSREIAVACYALLILVAGILVMAYETVQTRHSIKEVAPRIVVGFLTANMSLLLAGKAVSVANALSTGVISGGVNPKSAAATLTALVMGAVTNGGIFLIFIGIAMACVLIALLVCYVIRVALTVILIAGAPLALMCHALPQTEGIARWWWRAFAGVLAIQLAQSLTLVAALDVFLAKGGFSFFGPTKSGLVDVIVTLALLYILFKIPFWILHSIRVGNGRSFAGSVVKGVIAYKTLGLLGLRGAAGTGARRLGGGGDGGGGHGRPGGGGPGIVPGGGGGAAGGPVRPGGTVPSRGPGGPERRRSNTTTRRPPRPATGQPHASTPTSRRGPAAGGPVVADLGTFAPPTRPGRPPVSREARPATARTAAHAARTTARTPPVDLPRRSQQPPRARPTRTAPERLVTANPVTPPSAPVPPRRPVTTPTPPPLPTATRPPATTRSR